jgi:hypothetical protein
MNNDMDMAGRSAPPRDVADSFGIEPLATGKALDIAVDIANRLALGLPPTPVAPVAPPTPAPELEGLACIFHRGIEQRSGERVRRLEITQPNENATHRFFDYRL